MTIRLALTDADIASAYPVMQELRPRLMREEFVARVQRQGAFGYRIAFSEQAAGVVATAGFRIGESLSWGRFLYVDDLVTLSAHRSQGHGARLLAWLREYAVREGCEQLHLDSGIQRKDAHRFYEREGMAMAAYHFMDALLDRKR